MLVVDRSELIFKDQKTFLAISTAEASPNSIKVPWRSPDQQKNHMCWGIWVALLSRKSCWLHLSHISHRNSTTAVLVRTGGIFTLFGAGGRDTWAMLGGLAIGRWKSTMCSFDRHLFIHNPCHIVHKLSYLDRDNKSEILNVLSPNWLLCRMISHFPPTSCVGLVSLLEHHSPLTNQHPKSV